MRAKLQWDPGKEAILNDEESAKMLDCPIRVPWSLDAYGRHPFCQRAFLGSPFCLIDFKIRPWISADVVS